MTKSEILEYLRNAIGVALGVSASASGILVSAKTMRTPAEASPSTALTEQRERLFERMQTELDLQPEVMQRIRSIFERSTVLGQGNPSLSVHPMSLHECQERRQHGVIHAGDPRCGGPHMVVVVEPSEDEHDGGGGLCIDQYEFPNLPCEYPVVHVQASEAVELCRAVGKRICDAHEWEGACAGEVRSLELEYSFGQSRAVARQLHNAARNKIWAYGPTKDHGKCATGSSKTPTCIAGGYRNCGSNTYPTGAFPECVSPFGVYDQHGNVAEHMNLPLAAHELASRGGLGWTEMKGSWFVFATIEAHEDDCRWRAPDWHGSRMADPKSHSNYHLGFRCCRDVASELTND